MNKQKQPNAWFLATEIFLRHFISFYCIFISHQLAQSSKTSYNFFSIESAENCWANAKSRLSIELMYRNFRAIFVCSCSYLWRSCCPIDKKWPFSVKRLIRNGSCFSPKNLPFTEQSYHRFASFIIPKTSLDRVSIWLILSLVASLHSEWMKSCARFLIFFHNPSSVDPHCWLFSIQLAFFVWGGLCGIPREIPFEMCLGCLGISFAPHKSAIPIANPSDGIQFWVECTISENIINVDVMNGFVPIYQIAKRNRMYGVLTRALSMQSVHIHGCRLNLHKFSRSLHQLILFFFNIHHVNVHGLRREILICLSRSNNSQVFGWN